MNINNEDRVRFLEKCKDINCSKQECESCVARGECYKLRLSEKYK